MVQGPIPPPPAASYQPPASTGGDALKKVNGPGIALIATALIGAFFQLLNLLSTLLAGSDSGQLADVMVEMFEEMGLDSANTDMIVQAMQQSTLMTVISVTFGLIISGLIFYGGMKMRKLESWGIALAASILALVPCISPCCCIGIPIGIWALIVLMDDHVKEAFEQNKSFR